MVMHARKPQRISDGYFEKHQAHPYQKYTQKSERRAPTEYIPSDDRYTPLRSPNGNVHGHTSHASHGHHHYAHLAEERGYTTSRDSYLQKVSEKERDRDFKSSRNKYADCVRSPKDKRSERERSNHERSESDKKSRTSGLNISVSRSSKYDKRSAPTATVSASEWSEHISSSGKKYYYNSISEVSQWEKPRDWDTRRTSSKDSTYSNRNNSNRRSRSRLGRKETDKNSKRTNSGTDRYWNNNSRDGDGHERPRPKHAMAIHEGKEGPSLQDMDISPDRSTPLSEISYVCRESNSITRNNSEHSVPPVVVLDNSNNPSGSLLAAALPRIVAPPPIVIPANNGASGTSPGSEPPSGPSSGLTGGETPQRDPGPPTPTHSENMDPHAPPLHLDQPVQRKMESLGSYSSVVGGAMQHSPCPMLTPSLVNYVRSELTSHVTGWPADILEKQANKFTEEAYQLGCLQCTRVSSELKCARSIVRHTEIQATLQEQKIMYLRQQISRLEELKSQNSFMSED